MANQLKHREDFYVERIVIVGVGLIGGSLARVLKSQRVVGEVIGVGRTPEALQHAVDLGVIDRFEITIGACVDGADVVVIATPLGAMPGLFAEMASRLSAHTVVTDVGSVKRAPVEAARATLGNRFTRYVPAHPVAGTEQSGVAASFKELFEGHKVILTPLVDTDPDAIRIVTDLWTIAGAKTITMTVSEHDRILATTSHLPHMLAYALVEFVAGQQAAEQHFNLAAGGFYDFTRIASSDPVMWRDICLSNSDELTAKLREFSRHLDRLTNSIERADGQQLHGVFDNARRMRAAALESSCLTVTKK